MTPVAWLKIMIMNSNHNRLAGEKDPTYLHSWPSHVLSIRLTPTIVNLERKNWQKSPLQIFVPIECVFSCRDAIYPAQLSALYINTKSNSPPQCVIPARTHPTLARDGIVGGVCEISNPGPCSTLYLAERPMYPVQSNCQVVHLNSHEPHSGHSNGAIYQASQGRNIEL